MKPIPFTISKSHTWTHDGFSNRASFSYLLDYTLFYDTSSLLPAFLNLESKAFLNELQIQIASSEWMFEEWNSFLNDFWFHIFENRAKSKRFGVGQGSHPVKAGLIHKERHNFSSFFILKLFGLNFHELLTEPRKENFLKEDFFQSKYIENTNFMFYQPIAISQCQPTITGFLVSSDFSITFSGHNFFKLNSKNNSVVI